MSVLLRMNSFKHSFSPTELKIFQYIEKNPEQASHMTAKQLAQAANVSAPSVVRFTKKIGYTSLTDFKIQLSSELQSSKEVPSSYADVQPNESFQSIKEKITTNAQISLNETASILNEDAFEKAIALLKQAPAILTFGVGASALTAQDIVHKWSRIGQFVFHERDIHLFLPQVINASAHSLLWLISNSGKTPELLYLAEIAQKRQLPILTLTQLGNNPLHELATVGLQTARPMEAENRSAATNSILSQFLTVDTLFYLYISQNQQYTKQISESKQTMEDYKKH